MNTPVDGGRYRIVSEARFRRVGDEAVVILQDAGEVLVLNQVAGRILELLTNENSSKALIEQLLTEFDVSRQTLEQDVEVCLQELCEAGVVTAMSCALLEQEGR